MRPPDNLRTPSSTAYDVIVIGSGAGGGTLARALADTPARILILERGDFVPEEPENWDPSAVWRALRYRSTEQWLDGAGTPFQPYTHYNVGGNTKFWGSVLYGCGARTSASSATRTAYRRRGRSTTTRSSPTTSARSGCIRFTAKPAMTRPNRHAPRILMRRSHTRPG